MERLQPDLPQRHAPAPRVGGSDPDDDRPGVLPLIRLEHDDVVFQLTITGVGTEGWLRIRCTAAGDATVAIAEVPGPAWARILRRLRRSVWDLARQAFAAVTGTRQTPTVVPADLHVHRTGQRS